MVTAKPEKFFAYRRGGLKGRLQARLPATQKAKGLSMSHQIGAEMSLGAADTSVRATSRRGVVS
jgi:hypothetical protein